MNSSKSTQNQEKASTALVLRELIYDTQISNLLLRQGAAKPKEEQIVLEEEQFVKNLDEIIKRDYFPDLAKLEAYKEYKARKLAGETNIRIPTILIKRTPLVNPSKNEDPLKIPDSMPNKEEKKEENNAKIDIRGMSLEDYLARYTSEDNKSFDKLFDQQKSELEKKYAWMKKEAERSNSQVLAIKEANSEGLKSISWDKEKMLSKDLQYQIADAKANLFFPPEENTEKTIAKIKNFTDIEDFAAPPKEILKQNTRLPTNFVISQSHIESIFPYKNPIETISQEKCAEKLHDEDKFYGNTGGIRTPDLLGINREEQKYESALDKIRDLAQKRLGHKQNSNKETPIIKGYKLVKPEAYNLLEILKSPIMTWGEIIDEPILIGPANFSFEPENTDERSSNLFKVPAAPEREQLSHNLINQATKRKNENKLLEERRKKQNLTDKKYHKTTELSAPAKELLRKTSGRRIGSIFENQSANYTGKIGNLVKTPKIVIPPK